MAQTQQYLLYELAAGYALFLRKEIPELEQLLTETQSALQDFARFRKMIALVSFAPFTTAEMAVQNMDAVVNGIMSPFLNDFITLHLGGTKKKHVELGVADSNLGKTIQETLMIKCVINDTVHEIFRWIRFHLSSLLPNQKDADIQQAQLGLAHGFSRISVKMNVNRSDNMIIQAISLLDQMDKDINTFAMRVKEWYGWHFPELKKIVADNSQYSALVILLKNKSSVGAAIAPQMMEIVQNEAAVQEIISVAPISMGMDFNEQDFNNIECFAKRVVNLTAYRKQLYEYLCLKMSMVAPNLASLIGEQIGARLICQAGSLTNLAKFPASTVQILGAEKALFRALKLRGDTPKYGLIFHSTYIGRAAKEHKGRISRYLANKSSICSRLDCFMETPNGVIGKILGKQIDDRLKSLDSGMPMPTNQEVMDGALKEYKKSMKKRKHGEEENVEPQLEAEAVTANEEEKKKRKEQKKRRKEASKVKALNAVIEAQEPAAKKKKKKNDETA
jgi:nucleolar protein 56